MRDIFLPKIQSFISLIDTMEDSHKVMTECIRKFDEDLSLKANKSLLDQIQKEFEDTYIQNQYKIDISK